MSKAGKKLIEASKQLIAYAQGNSEGIKIHAVHVPDTLDVKAIRGKMEMTQPEFSSRFGFNVKAVQEWEQNRRRPQRAARILLTVISKEPEAVSRALS